ncbi:glutaconate CoA-transferase subunit B [Saccharopolyspora erythraea NRRL 2338]|uniref:Glutaconate CoA-transferase n=2 Tax=Saccharopolyspora erythraea TaxID=1836 RepID=A4FGV3_SACEN|nr:3-oxoadipate--succinyl-CoA transferase subunit B [Saccharopolyspora erythraea]EQD82613.1 3-oxoadipate:succinyl-CoA transferase subunit B [Saccharopolyspora erythraea D]PFG96982.1 glutaconate CoA-transferase subunit B [Saccharopolyspora erythraea NRRL 2338]QRK87198.1 3-oxoadipate--succinyl-CoA transferase subunit B [Saccharopolyspora erythraea]CAM03278.1 glutaconate CoA-transferase [Saccharopolyspora erythraea NRRL 2338]
MTDAEYTTTELLSVLSARELAGRRRVFAGIGLPTLAVALAQRTVAPDVGLVYESGVYGAHPQRLPESIGDSFLVSGAESVLSMSALFGFVLQGGHVDVGFLGAAQIDRWGNLNSTVIGEWERPKARLPGSGGAAEVMANSREVFVVMRRHDRRSFVDELDFCTSPGPARARAAVPDAPVRGRGVTTVITGLGLLRRESAEEELRLVAVHPGVDADQVREATGWPLEVAADLPTTNPPTERELRLLREEIDPRRVYLR